jgi:capsular polysaccharide export protein
MLSSFASIRLMEKGNLPELGSIRAVDGIAAAQSARAEAKLREPFLRIPPFPGAKISRFAEAGCASPLPDGLTDEIRRMRVGGSYWAAQPDIPKDCVLVRSAAALNAAARLSEGRPVVLWSVEGQPARAVSDGMTISGDCDPWHMLASAAAVVLEADDELRVIASLLDVPRYLYDPEHGRTTPDDGDSGSLLGEALFATEFENPFTGEPMGAVEAVELCAFWRRLIDSNRSIAGGVGFAFWKQDHVGSLLWNGTAPFRFLRTIPETVPSGPVALWRAKAPAQAVSALERLNTPLIEIEDGFLRSQGLGADCIPPLSITVDHLGAHFDPAVPSELECLLQDGEFDQQLIARAGELRRLIVAAGLGKYGQGSAAFERPAGKRRHILVPGQVEDDRAVQAGGCGLVSNLDLLKRVRAQAPDAYVLYKPHPDVLAGHRKGAIVDRVALRYADRVVGDIAIGSLIAMADEVHVNTSLAGFEALLRGKDVTTHGVPFYAGWGLTRDLGPVPARRTARRTIDELVAATLLLYPRYLDPVTGLPCPAEVVVERLSGCDAPEPGLLVGMRRLQGRLKRRFRSLVQ